MIPSNNFYKLLQEFEGCKLYAYKDSAGIWTIGIGTIQYPDGTRVKQGDKCSQAQADEWARYECGKKAAELNKVLTGVTLTQNQFDALLLLAYNIGSAGVSQSSLLRKIKSMTGMEPDYAKVIRECFCMWNKVTVNGKKVEVPGLTKRRNREADLFLS